MFSGEISVAADLEEGRRGCCGVEAAGRGGREDMASRSGRCVVPPGRGRTRRSSTSRAAFVKVKRGEVNRG
jgi:hypothetical protein